MRVEEIMSRNPACCTPDTMLPDVARAMVACDCGEIPVVESKNTMRPVGVVTDRDIACRSVATGRDPLQMKAGECMTSPCVTITPDTDIDDCCRLMEENQIRRVVVVDQSGRCCGIVAQADIARHAPKRETARMVTQVSRPPARSPAIAL